jgi:hypothetical protein
MHGGAATKLFQPHATTVGSSVRGSFGSLIGGSGSTAAEELLPAREGDPSFRHVQP